MIAPWWRVLASRPSPSPPEPAVGAQLADGHELDDARLDVVEPVVVGVEHGAHVGQVEVVVTAGAPRQFEDAVQPGADPAMLRGLRAGALESVDLLGDRVVGGLRRLQLGQLRAVLGHDVAVALAELLANRLQLLAQEVFALLLVDAFGDVVADRLGHLQLGHVVARPVEKNLDPLADVDGGEHRGPEFVVELGPRGDIVGEGTRMARHPQQFREPPGPAQLGDDPEHAAELAAERLDAWSRPRIGDRLGIGVGGPPFGLVQGSDAGPTLDAHDGGGIAGRQRTDVGDLGDNGDLATAGVQQHARVVGAASRRDRRAQLLRTERQGHHGARAARQRGSRRPVGARCWAS